MFLLFLSGWCYLRFQLFFFSVKLRHQSFKKNLQGDTMDLHHHNPAVLHDLNRFNLMHVLSSWEFLSIYPNLPINYHLKIWGPLVHSCSDITLQQMYSWFVTRVIKSNMRSNLTTDSKLLPGLYDTWRDLHIWQFVPRRWMFGVALLMHLEDGRSYTTDFPRFAGICGAWVSKFHTHTKKQNSWQWFILGDPNSRFRDSQIGWFVWCFVGLSLPKTFQRSNLKERFY